MENAIAVKKAKPHSIIEARTINKPTINQLTLSCYTCFYVGYMISLFFSGDIYLSLQIKCPNFIIHILFGKNLIHYLIISQRFERK